MKKIIALVMVLCILTGCAPKEEILNNDIAKLETRISELQTEISNLETEKNALANEIVDAKIENGTAKYVVTFNIKQTHLTLDLKQHLKDAFNDISIQVPVDKEYYDSIEVGDTIADNFRMGSFIFKGSFGNWNVTVKDKSVH